MSQIFTLPKQVVIDPVTLVPSPGAKAYFYETGTSTPLAVYSDSDLTTPIAQPVVADSAGVFQVIYLGNSEYKMTLKKADDTLLYTVDPIESLAADQLNYARTSAEIAAGVTPVNYYIPSHTVCGYVIPDRYTSTFTDCTTAFNNAITIARSQDQLPIGLLDQEYVVTSPLNVSGVSVIGIGPYASRIKCHNTFTGTALMYLDSTTSGGAATQKYERFSLNGNRSSVGSSVQGLRLVGDCLHNTFSNIWIHECKGDALVHVPNAGTRPSVNTFQGMRIIDNDANGLSTTGGKNNTFINVDFENLGGIGVYGNNATENPEEYTFEECWIEKVGTTSDAVQMTGCYNWRFRGTTVQDYGAATPVTGHGFNVISSYFTTIENCPVAGRGASAANSKKYRFSSGARNKVICAQSNVAATDIDTGGTDVQFLLPYSSVLGTKNQIPFSNATSIAGNLTRYVGAGAGIVSATQTDVRAKSAGGMTVTELYVETTTTPGGSDTYIVTLYKNGSATGLTVTLTVANGASAVSNAADVIFAAGDTYSLLVQTSATATTIPAGGLHASLGVQM